MSWLGFARGAVRTLDPGAAMLAPRQRPKRWLLDDVIMLSMAIVLHLGIILPLRGDARWRRRSRAGPQPKRCSCRARVYEGSRTGSRQFDTVARARRREHDRNAGLQCGRGVRAPGTYHIYLAADLGCGINARPDRLHVVEVDVLPGDG